jgi:hypothetical protein
MFILLQSKGKWYKNKLFIISYKLNVKEILIYKLELFTYKSNFYKNKGFFNISIIYNKNIKLSYKKI